MSRLFSKLYHVWDVFANGQPLGNVKATLSDDKTNPGADALRTARMHYDIPAGAVLTVRRRENPHRAVKAG